MRVLCILTMAIVVICMCADAETFGEIAFPHGTISGVVTDLESETPVSGAMVEVTKSGFSFGLSAETDADGKYTIENVPAGVFDVSISKAGCLSKSISEVEVKEGEVTSNVNAVIQLITTIEIGEAARNFTLGTIDGKMFKLASFKGKNIVVLGIGNPYG